MKIIVDTCVWSLALRRKTVLDNPYVMELGYLIQEVRVQMIGPIRQEILSGISSQRQFEKLRDHLSSFPDLELATKVYEQAALFYNINRAKGIQGSNTDFLICAASKLYDMSILTFDKDFTYFQEHISIKFHKPRTLSK